MQGPMRLVRNKLQYCLLYFLISDIYEMYVTMKS